MSREGELFERPAAESGNAEGVRRAEAGASEDAGAEESGPPRPSRRIPGEIVFEPVPSGVRVTARDDRNKVLWGFIGSREMLGQVHCPVAVYDTLQELLAEELGEGGAPRRDAGAMEAAQRALAALEQTLAGLKASIEVKKISGATLERAGVIARIASDANRMISLEASSLRGTRGGRVAPED